MPTVDRDIEHLWPKFSAIAERILHNLGEYCKVHQPSWRPVFGEGFRSTARQRELFAKRPRVTYKDGVRNKSRHQSGMAFDMWFEHNGQIEFDDVPQDILDYYGHLCRAEGMTWGGDWKKLVDEPHCEWPTGDLASYRLARDWLKTKGLA